MGHAYIVRRGGSVKESGGGSAFNLISAASVDALPSNAAQRTIAVITDQTIGKLYMQPTVPTVAVSGDLVILTSKPSKTILLSEDGNVEFGIDGAYINIDGAWSFVDTYIRLDDAWALLWSGQLYYNNNQYADYTGGWTVTGKKSTGTSGATPTEPNVELQYQGTKIKISLGETASQAGMFYLPTLIDLTPYKKIVFKGIFQCADNYPRNLTAAVWSSIGSYYTDNMLAKYQVPGNTEVNLIEIDVSGVNQVGYVGFGITGPNKASVAFGGVTSVVLESAYLVLNEL